MGPFPIRLTNQVDGTKSGLINQGETMNFIANRFVAGVYCAILVGSWLGTGLGSGAMAAPPPAPKLTGGYDVTGTVFCQPGGLDTKSGAYDVTVGLITFYPSAGDVTLQQTQVLGSATDTSLPFSVVKKSYEYTYSNTSSTLTLNNVAYSVVYSDFSGNVAGAVSGVGIDANGCARNFTMQRAPT
jgi:hypothetical protein